MSTSKSISIEEKEESIFHKLAPEFLSEMKTILGAEYEDFIASYDESKTNSIRLNTLKMDSESFEKLNLFDIDFKKDRLSWADEGYYIDLQQKASRNILFDAGLYYIQEPSAMSVVGRCKIEEGEKILDLCASPGGKSTYILSKLNNTGILVSNEFNKSRVRALGENLEKFGAINSIITNMSSTELLKFFKGYFDKIFIDAPCSGQGMFRKDNFAIEDWSQHKVEECVSIQKNLIRDAYHMLKDKGMIVYSTCTFTRKENEDIIDDFTKEFVKTELISMERIWPHREKGEGHFCAKIRKLNDYDHIGINKIKDKKINKKIKSCSVSLNEFEDFCQKTLNPSFLKEIKEKYKFIQKEDLLYIFPSSINIPDLPRTLRKGLLLGQVKKNRFEPSHAFAMVLNKDRVKNFVNFAYDDDQVKKYISGSSLDTDNSRGWTLVCVEGIGLGWGKESNGVLKNKYPKGLRKNI